MRLPRVRSATPSTTKPPRRRMRTGEVWPQQAIRICGRVMATVSGSVMDLEGVVGTAPPRGQDPPRPGGDHQGRRALLSRLLDPVRWEDRHQRLAAQPVLRACTRSDIRTLARLGDECVIPAETVVCHEGRIGYWFFVVIDGGIRLSRDGKTLATVGAGSHFGEIAILGFGPQPMTATALVDSAVYVLGRRHRLDLIHAMHGLRRGLFPGVPADAFQEKIRELRAEGQEGWRRLPQRHDATEPARIGLLAGTLHVLPSRARTPIGAPLSALIAGPEPAGNSPEPTSRRETRAGPLKRRVLGVACASAVAALVTIGFLFHPGLLVVRPHAVIDVTDDVVVEGVPTHEPSGRYILTAVSISEPNLFGVAHALLRGEQTLTAEDVDDPIGQRALAREEYLGSQRDVVAFIAARAGIDPSQVVVSFRDRQLSGPSAGLVYALLLADITRQVDVPRGRVIAATGILEHDGDVLPVGFVAIKAQVAQRADADLFVVPTAQGVGRGGTSVVAVATFDDALRALAIAGSQTPAAPHRSPRVAGP